MQQKPVDAVLASDAEGVLAAALSATGTSFTLQAGQGSAFPASDFSVEINGETIDVGTRTTDTFSSLTRANPVPHNGGAHGEHVYHVTSGAAIADAVAAGPGGSQPAQATYSGSAPESIDNNSTTALAWTTLGSGDDLLDRTDPAIPVLLADGFYALTADVFGDALTAGGYCLLAVVFVPVTGTNIQSLSESFHPENSVGASIVFEAATGDGLEVTVMNQDGVSARSFSLNTAALMKLA